MVRKLADWTYRSVDQDHVALLWSDATASPKKLI